ncbi:hypothetical protein MY11210_005599 [Beauveria gryllotalpidicola]
MHDPASPDGITHPSRVRAAPPPQAIPVRRYTRWWLLGTSWKAQVGQAVETVGVPSLA